MSSLQIGLIIAGILLVIGVIAYNRWQERRLARSLGTARPPADVPDAEIPARGRVEPTLGADAARLQGGVASAGMPAFRAGSPAETGFEAPLDVVPAAAPFDDDRSAGPDGRQHHDNASGSSGPGLHVSDEPQGDVATSLLAPSRGAGSGTKSVPQPDHEIECLIPLQPASLVPAGAVGAGLHARIGKPLRWFGRVDARSDWQRLSSDTPGRFSDVVACMLLADRNGAASRAQLETFARIVGEIAPTLPAAFAPPDIAREAARAESLDRLCAELDVQIGLTLQKPDPGSIAGTRLRGVAEAAGFRLGVGGRFELASEETGAVVYTLQNLRPEPFTAESLRLTATNGVVFVLDVARLAEPARVFDQMKLAAKRLAVTLGAELVDDNRRTLDDAAFASIREQVVAAAEALRAVHIEPGSARAMALFSA